MSTRIVEATPRISHVEMCQSCDGWDAHCTVVTDEPIVTLGIFVVSDVRSPLEFQERLPAALEKFLVGLVGQTFDNQKPS